MNYIPYSRARELIQNKKAMLFNRNILWLRISANQIKVFSRSTGLKGFVNPFISTETPEKLDFYFQEYGLLSLNLL